MLGHVGLGFGLGVGVLGLGGLFWGFGGVVLGLGVVHFGSAACWAVFFCLVGCVGACGVGFRGLMRFFGLGGLILVLGGLVLGLGVVNFGM